MSDKKQENDFLNEIQQKINKRSGGLYYNEKLKSIKKNLTITSIVVITVIVLWALINFIFQKVSVDKEFTSSKKPVSYTPKSKTKSNIGKAVFLKNKAPQREKYKYIFTKTENFSIEDKKTIKKVLKKSTFTKMNKENYILEIPEIELKSILKVILSLNLKLKKEKYIDNSKTYQIIIKKDILD